ALLTGLYCLLANLAQRQALVLCIDDAHWSDLASLRFLHFLRARLEGLPALLAVVTRLGDPGAESGLVAELASDPVVETLRLAPLSEGAVTEIVEQELGSSADREFAAACHESTGGNPFLVSELVSDLRRDGIAP